MLISAKKWNIIKNTNLLSHIKMGKEIFTCSDIETVNNKFYRHESPVSLMDVDIEKILVSNKISFGEKNYKYWLLA